MTPIQCACPRCKAAMRVAAALPARVQCPFCGQAFVVGTQVAAGPPRRTASPPPPPTRSRTSGVRRPSAPPPPPPAGSGRSVLLATLAVLALAGTGAGVAFLFLRDGKGSEEPPAVQVPPVVL